VRVPLAVSSALARAIEEAESSAPAGPIARPLSAAGAAWVVAYSGGLDSSALMWAAADWAHRRGRRVTAVHIHHGLQPEADAWWLHTQAEVKRAQAMGLPVQWQGLCAKGAPSSGESVEAWARQQRRRLLDQAARASGAAGVLLAHHQQDQAETWLLQALRSAGPAGLSAMPERMWQAGLCWLRPWLKLPRELLVQFARESHWGWVEDPSNLDSRFARNALRNQVWPALLVAFPQANQALVRSARHAAQAQRALGEYADLDLQAMGVKPLPGQAGPLPLQPFLALSEARRVAVLRRWWVLQGWPPPSWRWTERLLRELPLSLTASQSPHWATAQGQLWVHRACLYALSDAQAGEPVAEPDKASAAALASGAAPEPPSGVGDTWPLPPAGWLWVQADRPAGAGVPAAALQGLNWRPRSGGERFSLGPGRPARSLKKQFQAVNVPPWQRRQDLLWSGDRLAWVPGLGWEAGFAHQARREFVHEVTWIDLHPLGERAPQTGAW
jgi:tRNA(Ile)-lysidine synthase